MGRSGNKKISYRPRLRSNGTRYLVAIDHLYIYCVVCSLLLKFYALKMINLSKLQDNLISIKNVNVNFIEIGQGASVFYAIQSPFFCKVLPKFLLPLK